MTDLDIELEGLRNWLAVVAKGMTLGKGNTHADWQDVAQEGWVAAWRAGQSYRPSTDGRGTREGWMKYKAEKAMLSVPRGRKYKEQPVEADRGVWDELQATDNLDAIETAYHSGEILAALAGLTPRQREYLYRRFWLGQTYTEMAKEMNTPNPGTLWIAKKYGAKARLTEALAHLVDAA